MHGSVLKFYSKMHNNDNLCFMQKWQELEEEEQEPMHQKGGHQEGRPDLHLGVWFFQYFSLKFSYL